MKWQHPTFSLKFKFPKTSYWVLIKSNVQVISVSTILRKPFTEHVGQVCWVHKNVNSVIHIWKQQCCVDTSFAWVYPQEENELSTPWFQLEQFLPFVDPIKKKMKKWWRCGQSEKWDDEAMPGQPGPKDGRLDPTKDGRLGRMKESASNTFHSFSNHHYQPYFISSKTLTPV